jgi:anthranilate synthase component 1
MASQAKLDIRPSAAEAHTLYEQASKGTVKPTLLPVCITVPSDLQTPSAIYLKLSNGYACLIYLVPPLNSLD